MTFAAAVAGFVVGLGLAFLFFKWVMSGIGPRF